ncbi:SPATS2-like protein isoform X3 [Erinaceus europaeus]|uniref:SPATS2-like protein isoform X3 n=1 Tax=Erinaceus europaeus TaxID=9365 RepID=A0ABM3XMW9_ERIEU|nr:SPATS2-like protein isoform X3 [Erinaceus europaeus]
MHGLNPRSLPGARSAHTRGAHPAGAQREQAGLDTQSPSSPAPRGSESTPETKLQSGISPWIPRTYFTRSKMAELNTHVNVKEKIYAVRSVVPNKSNNEIVLVLQQFDFNVDKAVQAFVDGSAIQVLKEWNMTGKKKNNKRKRSKSKQHQGNKDAKDKAEKPEAGPLQPPPPPPQIPNGHVNGFEKDSSSPDSASEKPVLLPREKKISILEEPSKTFCGVTGPNIEKSVKDLQRCTVSLTRYRVMIKEEVDSSVKKIKAAFAELHNCIIDKEVSLMAEMDKVKEEAMEILTARQKKAEELKKLTDLASQMAEMQLAELRAEIKHFVSERKYDEELGKAARFSCDIEQLKAQIMLCGEITHPKNSYSSRTPCTSLLPLLNAHPASSGKQGNFPRKSSSHTKPSEGKAANPKMANNLPNTADTSHQAMPVNKQNGSSSQRRRFNPQYHNRLNGATKPQGSGNEGDPMGKGNNRHEHRRPPHNGFRPKNKGGGKNQEATLGTKTPEASAHPEKPRRRQHTADNSEARPLRGSVSRVSQCNLCPTRIEVSTDTTVLSVPAVTLVA